MEGWGRNDYNSDPYPVYWPGILALCAVPLLIHFALAGRYGFFRDELYYLACAAHPAWGYVDQPPLSIFILKAFTSVFGQSLFAVRLAGFLAGSGIVVTFGLLARECGAAVRGQLFSAAFAAFCPVILVVTHLYSMNGLDILLSALAVLAWLKARDPYKRGQWLVFGLFLGLALLNKLSAALLLAGIGISMLLSHRRRELLSWQPWTGLLIALLIFSPHALWLSSHDYISLEFIRNATLYKMLPVPPGQFLIVQAIVNNPLLTLMILLGLWTGLQNRADRPASLAFLVVLGVLVASMKSRENYLTPALCLVVPPGAILLGKWFEERRVAQNFYIGALAVSTAIIGCFALPVLPPETFIKITGSSSASLPAAERGKKSPLQGHADMFGWPQMAAAAYQVWSQIPDPQKPKTPVLGLNYGESSAVWLFNQDHPEMKVIGRHNNWWLWGTDGWDGQVLVVVGELPESLASQFTSIRVVTTLDQPYAVPEEAHAPISIAKGLKIPVPEFWSMAKHMQ